MQQSMTLGLAVPKGKDSATHIATFLRPCSTRPAATFPRVSGFSNHYQQQEVREPIWRRRPSAARGGAEELDDTQPTSQLESHSGSCYWIWVGNPTIRGSSSRPTSAPRVRRGAATKKLPRHHQFVDSVLCTRWFLCSCAVSFSGRKGSLPESGS
jgi:hypothetical protein